MYSQLRGVVVDRSGQAITLDVNGVGFEVFCSERALSKLGFNEEATITIYTDVREDHIRLFGFEDKLEKQVFLFLKAVKGVGSKSASEIISHIEKKELLRVIGASDVARLQAVKGIGKKTAERIVVELRDKVRQLGLDIPAQTLGEQVVKSNAAGDAIEALKALGFVTKEAEFAVGKVSALPECAEMDSGEIVKEALKYV